VTILPAFLSSKPFFLRVMAAIFVSGVGTSLTAVAVYQELSRRNVGPAGFAIAYAAGLLPGLLTSMLPASHARKWHLGKVMIVAEIVGLLSLVFPFLGVEKAHIGWLLVSEAMASAVGGFLVPLFKSLERASFAEEEFPQLASLDTFLFTANFVLAQGIGALIASQLPLRAFLALDALTYVVALLLIVPVAARAPALGIDDDSRRIRVHLQVHQKRALFILPWLALVCAPPMILLPARGAEWGLSFRIIGALSIAPVLLLMCARSLGQILGPVVALKLDMRRLSDAAWALPSALLAYLILYLGAYRSSSLVVVAALVVLAHTASNVVYTVGTFQMLKAFNPEETVWASGWIYRLMTLITGVSGLLMGAVADRFGSGLVLAGSAVVFAVGTVLLHHAFSVKGAPVVPDTV
jgi:MFS family permease